MKKDSKKKVVKKEDIIKAKEEAKELLNELSSEQLEKVTGGAEPGDTREDLSLSMINNEYISGNIDVDGWAE